MFTKTEFKSIVDLVTKFPNEKSCHQYLAGQRWEGLLECPFDGCGSEKAYVFADGIRYKCCKCKKIYTAKTGTFMESSKLPTLKWFIAMYLVTHKKGISSVQLSKDLNVTQKTAWFILQRIRSALGNEVNKANLEGVVELDEAFYGGKNKNRHYRKRIDYKKVTGRAYPDKVPIFGMYERNTGRVRAMVISRKQFNSMARTITYNIAPGSTLMTDDWVGYKPVDKIYTRHFIEHKKYIYADGDVTTNRIENFWSHLKRGLHGTYIRVTPKHLNRYVQEFAWRFNNRNFAVQQQMNNIISQMCCRLKYKDLIAA